MPLVELTAYSIESVCTTSVSHGKINVILDMAAGQIRAAVFNMINDMPKDEAQHFLRTEFSTLLGDKA